MSGSVTHAAWTHISAGPANSTASTSVWATCSALPFLVFAAELSAGASCCIGKVSSIPWEGAACATGRFATPSLYRLVPQTQSHERVRLGAPFMPRSVRNGWEIIRNHFRAINTAATWSSYAS